MKWTAYYNAKNYFTNCVERVYLGKSFKTRKELISFLNHLGFVAPDHLIKNNQMTDAKKIINLVKE